MSAAAAGSGGFEGGTVLLVDDDPEIRSTLQQFLERLGILVI